MHTWAHRVRFVAPLAAAERFLELARHVADWSEGPVLAPADASTAGEREYILSGVTNDFVPDETLTALCRQSACQHRETVTRPNRPVPLHD